MLRISPASHYERNSEDSEQGNTASGLFCHFFLPASSRKKYA